MRAATIFIFFIILFAACSNPVVYEEPEVLIPILEPISPPQEEPYIPTEEEYEPPTCKAPEECTCEYCEYEAYIYPPPMRLPMVALTFDDGPSVYTERILDVLEIYGGQVTFCVLGNRIEDWQNTIRRAVCHGHEVIGHSWNHRNLTRLNADQIAEQITDTSAAIQAVTGSPAPSIFRAPYGRQNAAVRNVSRELGYSLLNWSIDPRDWEIRDADHIYNFIMDNVQDGSIVVLHDIRPYTSDAMARVIPSLIERGFQLVTASELLEYFYGELVPGWEYARGHDIPEWMLDVSEDIYNEAIDSEDTTDIQ